MRTIVLGLLILLAFSSVPLHAQEFWEWIPESPSKHVDWIAIDSTGGIIISTYNLEPDSVGNFY